jgi:conjugative relaxase-like TrwC/TraI family protein
VADEATQSRIVHAHHEAVAEVVGFMEREIAATRTGTTAYDGAVAQVDVNGLIATAFDHFDSRAGDPHLHTHVVISNKVQTLLDGKWRSLTDGQCTRLWLRYPSSTELCSPISSPGAIGY